MPQTNNKNAILAKLKSKGADKSIKKHKDDAIEVPKVGGSIPPGIEYGRAKLIIAKFDEYKPGKLNAGKPFVNLQAVVVDVEDDDPKLKRAIKQRTFNSEDLFDTPKASKIKTFDQHLANLLNKLRYHFGKDTSGVDSLDDVATILDELETEQPCFAFRTWKGKPTKQYPDPKLRVDWLEHLPDYVAPDESESGVVDNSAGEDTTDDESSTDSDEGSADADDVDTTDDTDSSSDDDSDSSSQLDELDELLEKANNDDKAAKKAIEAKGKELGIGEEVKNADSWDAAVELIKEKMAEGEGSSDDDDSSQDDEPWVPQVGENYKVKVGTEKKAIDVKVMKVNTKNNTMDVKGVANKKDYKGVKWSNDDGEKKINEQDI